MLTIYRAIQQKLANKHAVSESEVHQSWMNREGKILEEVREKNRGANPRYWFLAETDTGRLLKVVFTLDPDEEFPVIITAYEPNSSEERIYEQENS